jgi:hypothetical protein
MLQVSVPNISSFFRRMLQGCYLDVAYISHIHCKSFIWMLHVFATVFQVFSYVFACVSGVFPVATVFSSVFICFSSVLIIKTRFLFH